MLLRNYYNILAMNLFASNGNSNTMFADGYLSVKREDAGIYYGYSSGSHNDVTDYSLGHSSFEFGTGTTPTSFDDYKLESKVGITILNSNVYGASYDATTKIWSAKKMCNLQNNTSEDITITEVGIRTTYAGYKSNVVSCNPLVYREVLKEPFTVKAGETVTYTHELNIQFPQ